MNLFDLLCRGATVYVDEVQITQKPRAEQMNLFDLLCRGATVYVDEVQITQKPRADLTDRAASLLIGIAPVGKVW